MLLKKQTTYILFILCLAFLSSCKKGLDEIEYPSTVYLPQSGLSEHTVLLGESIHSLGVYKSGINNQGKLTASLALDLDSFATFQASNPSYELLPEKYFSIPNYEVSFGENEENSPLHIQLKNIDEDYVNKNYILPISIVSVSEGSSLNSEKSTAFLHFTRFRNFYEGQYRTVGTVFPTENPDQIRKVDEIISPISVSSNTLRISGPEAGLNLSLIISNEQVKIEGEAGSEHFLIKSDERSNYSGHFDPVYQRFKGDFKIRYTYTLNDTEFTVEIDMKFTL